MKIVVDFERGRLQKNFRPRRLGGGIGHTRKRREKGGVGFLRYVLFPIYENREELMFFFIVWSFKPFRHQLFIRFIGEPKR